MTEAPTWVRRFTATSIGVPQGTDADPDRPPRVTNRSGSSQVWAVDLNDGSWRQISHEPVGVETARMRPGGRAAWGQGRAADEGGGRGRWRPTGGARGGGARTGGGGGVRGAAPSGGGDAAPVFPDLPDGWL